MTMDVNELLQRGLDFHRIGQLDEAVKFYTQVIRFAPNASIAHFYLGIAKRDLGMLDEAILNLRNAIATDPKFFTAYFDLGNVYYATGKKLDALQCYLSVIELQSDFGKAYNNINVILQELKDPEIALMCYRRIFESVKDFAQIGPLRVRIEPSSACNLRCQHCPTGTNYKKTDRSIMKMDVFERILAQLKGFKNIFDCFLYLGGEPLLNANLASMCRRVKEETSIVQVSFNTNGMLINEQVCQDLAGSNIDRIGVSIDGRSPEENNAIRRGSNYDTVVANINTMISYMPSTVIAIDSTVIKRPNDSDKPEVPHSLNRDFPNICKSVSYAMVWPGFKKDKSMLTNLKTETLKPDMFCIMPFTNMVIRANGDVILCCYDILGEHVIGNIFKKDLMSIWNSGAYQKLRNSVINRNIKQLPKVCRKCKQYTGDILLIG